MIRSNVIARADSNFLWEKRELDSVSDGGERGQYLVAAGDVEDAIRWGFGEAAAEEARVSRRRTHQAGSLFAQNCTPPTLSTRSFFHSCPLAAAKLAQRSGLPCQNA